MPESLLSQRVDAIRRLARRNATAALAKVVAKSRAEDLAEAIVHVGGQEQRLVFGQIKDDAVAAEVLTRVDIDAFTTLTRDCPPERLASLFQAMEPDDQTDLLEQLPDEQREAVLARIQGEERAQVEELMGYPSDTAGGIMVPQAFRLHADTSCRDAIAAVQEAADHELIYYVYVESDAGQLIGVISLRNLLIHPPSTRLEGIMATDVITVAPHTDQEEVARIAGRYGLLAVPVVDDQRHLLGIVTVDDVIDVIREEAAEDMLLMAGVSEQAVELTRTNPLSAIVSRIPWLFVTLLGGLGISELIKRFNDTLQADLVLAAFIPIVMGMGGNVGVQSATMAVRNIATGHTDSGLFGNVFREVLVGMLMGIIFGALIGGYCFARYRNPGLALCVGGALIASMTAATLVGTLVPVTLHRLRVDPAIATGPFVTTAIDAVGLSIYLIIASIALQLFV